MSPNVSDTPIQLDAETISSGIPLVSRPVVTKEGEEVGVITDIEGMLLAEADGEAVEEAVGKTE